MNGGSTVPGGGYDGCSITGGAAEAPGGWTSTLIEARLQGGAISVMGESAAAAEGAPAASSAAAPSLRRSEVAVAKAKSSAASAALLLLS